MSKKFSFKDLKNKVDKTSEIAAASDKAFNYEYGFIHSGNYILNALLSGSLLGGYAESKVIGLEGVTGVGKTFLALNSVREYQKMDYSVCYYDTEGAITKKLVNSFDVSIDEDIWDYKLVATVEEFRTDITNRIQALIDAKRQGYEIPKTVFVLDSIGNLASKKELDDALSGNDKVDMTRAKVLKSLFRIISAKLTEIGASLIYTNHVYKTTDLYAATVSSGGSGSSYAASIVVQMTKAQLKEGDSKNGVIVTAKTVKNRFARPELVKFHIHFKKGMNPYVGLHEYLSWENCGIENGKIIDEKEFNKIAEKYGYKDESLIQDILDTEYEKNNNKYYFVNVSNMKKIKMSGVKKWAVKHLTSEVEVNDLLTEKVFVKEVLEELDKNVITEKFSYGEVNKEDDLDEVFNINIDKKDDSSKINEVDNFLN